MIADAEEHGAAVLGVPMKATVKVSKRRPSLVAVGGCYLLSLDNSRGTFDIFWSSTFPHPPMHSTLPSAASCGAGERRRRVRTADDRPIAPLGHPNPAGEIGFYELVLLCFVAGQRL